jgi:hypothetical protein
MDFQESWAIESAKNAMPFTEAERLAASCGRDAVPQLEKFNQKYTTDNTWFDDGSYFKFVPMDNQEIERAAVRLGRYYLMLLQRRGLVGF